MKCSRVKETQRIIIIPVHPPFPKEESLGIPLFDKEGAGEIFK